MFSARLFVRIVEKEQNNNIMLALVQSLWKHIFGMSVIFTIIMVVVIVSTQMQVPIYEVNSKVMIKFGREYVYRSLEKEKDGDISPALRFDAKEIINTEIEIIKSSELVEEVVTSIGLKTLFPKMVQDVENIDSLIPYAVDSFQGALKVALIKGSNVLSIHFQHPEPEIAVMAVIDLIERYKGRHLEIFKNPNVSILESQEAKFAVKLKAAEDAKQHYKNDNGIFSLHDQTKIAMHQYAEVQTYYVKESSQLEWLAKENEFLVKQLETMEKNTLLTKAVHERGNIELLELRLMDRQQMYRNLKEKYPDDNRLVVSAADEIESLLFFLKDLASTANTYETTTTGPSEHFKIIDRAVINTSAKYNAQIQKVAIIKQEVASLKDGLTVLAEHEIAIKRLNDTIESVEISYRSFYNKLVESRVQEVMDREKMMNVVVIDKPRLPLRPIKPRKKMRLLVGIVLAVASCFFYTLFREYVWVSKK